MFAHQLGNLYIKDGYTDKLKGLNTNKNIKNTSYFSYSQLITNDTQLLRNMYKKDGVVKTVCELPVLEAFKNGRETNIVDQKQKEDFLSLYKKFGIDIKLQNAIIEARLLGTCYLLINTLDDILDKPIDFSKLKDKLVAINVVDRDTLSIVDIDRNILSPTYLQPKMYQTYSTDVFVQIHPSRVVMIKGFDGGSRDIIDNNGLGYSILEYLDSAIKDTQIANQLMINLLTQSNQDVYKIKDFNKMVSSPDGKGLKLLQEMQSAKSMLNAIAIDSEGDYVNVSKNFAGLDKVTTQMLYLVSMYTQIPMTKLIGKSPDGMNSTGTSDMDNYYDMVKSTIQKAILEPVYTYLDTIISYSLFGSDVVISSEFRPLKLMSQKEIAELNDKKADTDKKYYEMGALNEYDIGMSLALDNRYPSLTVEVVKQRQSIFESESSDIDNSESVANGD